MFVDVANPARNRATKIRAPIRANIKVQFTLSDLANDYATSASVTNLATPPAPLGAFAILSFDFDFDFFSSLSPAWERCKEAEVIFVTASTASTLWVYPHLKTALEIFAPLPPIFKETIVSD